MNSDTVLQLVQKGFRVTLGATTSLVETLQDPQKRQQNFSQMQAELSDRVQEWAAKGEITEQEARNFMDAILNQKGNSSSTQPSSTTTSDSSYATTPTAPADVQLELQELTLQIAAIRTELEKLRKPDSNI